VLGPVFGPPLYMHTYIHIVFLRGFWQIRPSGFHFFGFLNSLQSNDVRLASNPQPGGRTIAQPASRRLPTAAARVRAGIMSSWTCSGQSGTGTRFLRVLRFLLPIIIPPTAPHSSIIRGWYNRPISGRRIKWTQSHPTIRN
jgi:hypothetical protein